MSFLKSFWNHKSPTEASNPAVPITELQTQGITKPTLPEQDLGVQEPEIDEAELYREIQDAQEILLQEARAVLKNPPSPERQAQLEALANLGFISTREQQEYKGVLAARELERLIEQYQQEYPCNRFIDRDSVTRVCEKYNLYMVQANRYKDDIPDRNQKEIINFRIRRALIRTEATVRASRSSVDFSAIINDYRSTLDPQELIPACGLVILAPEHKINMAGLRKVGRILVKDDPIVLQPVQGGFLIVSAWGPEASDQEVVNTKMN